MTNRERSLNLAPTTTGGSRAIFLLFALLVCGFLGAFVLCCCLHGRLLVVFVWCVWDSVALLTCVFGGWLVYWPQKKRANLAA